MINKKKLLLNALIFGFFIFLGVLILIVYTDYHNRNLKKDGVLGATVQGLVVNSSLTSVNQVAQGEYDLVIKYTFENHAIYPIKKLQGNTNLQTTFTSFTYQVLSINSSALHPNSSFNGSSNTKLLVGTDEIQPGSTSEVTITVRVFAENFQTSFSNYVEGSGVLKLPPVTQGDYNGGGNGYGDEGNVGDTGTPTPVPCTTEDPDCGSTDWNLLDPNPDQDPDLNNPCSDPDFDCEGWMNNGGGNNQGGGSDQGGSGTGQGEEPVVSGNDELILTLPTPSPSIGGATPTSSPTPSTVGITTPTPSPSLAARIGVPTNTPTPTVLGLVPTLTPTPTIGGVGAPAPSTTPPGQVLGISIPNTSFDIRSILLLGTSLSLLLLALKTYLKKH